MKKSLLFLGLLGLVSSAQAQIVLGPWTQVNTVNPPTFAPGSIIDAIVTVSPTACWAVTEENSTSSLANNFLVSIGTAGTQFNGGVIGAVGANITFETSNIAPVGASVTTAIAGNYPPLGAMPTAGGEILRTTNGGVSWTKVLTFANSTTSFLDFVHMFDANNGVAVGDPANNYFEIYTTSNGGVTWTRVPQANIPPLLNADEYGLVRSFFAQGSTIWFGGASAVDTNPVRVFKSTNMGLNWTASPVTPLTGNISKLAFKDANNGIAYNAKVTGNTVTAVNLISTSDGGATWSTITPVSSATGDFFRADIDAVNGRYYSVGSRFPIGSPRSNNDYGSSYSTDGINWTNLSITTAVPVTTDLTQLFTAVDLIPSGTVNAVGYVGAVTDGNGVGGVYKSRATGVLATRNTALQSTLGVYPNPSTSGVFTVELGSDLTAGASLTVTDALGRTVKSQTLNAAAIGAKRLSLDLSGEKIGVYTLQIRTEAGIATQKIVIE